MADGKSVLMSAGSLYNYGFCPSVVKLDADAVAS